MAVVYLSLEVNGDTVTPSVGVQSHRSNYFGSGEAPQPDLATVRKATEITNRVLDFAEMIKSGDA